MSELEDAQREYVKNSYTTEDGTPIVTKAYADDYIAALEAENEGLKCCGNCGNLDWDDCDMDGMCHFSREHDHDIEMVRPWLSCHFARSRWARRKP